MDTNGWTNLRLHSNSPCINAGKNLYVSSSTDLDGNPRIQGGTVDMGAYEFQNPDSTISYAWLQRYGFPTDGSADPLDPDHDGQNNFQEWRCGTDPTNAASALRMLPPEISGSNLVLSWPSAAGVTYAIEGSTNLFSTPAFMTLASNISGQTLSVNCAFTVTNAFTNSTAFYRVRVEE